MQYLSKIHKKEQNLEQVFTPLLRHSLCVNVQTDRQTVPISTFHHLMEKRKKNLQHYANREEANMLIPEHKSTQTRCSGLYSHV